MKKYENVQIRITPHAHTQYCSRVEPTDMNKLTEQCQKQFDQTNYGYNRRNFMHLDGVWWVYEIKEKEMIFITCYGRSDMHMPKALIWAARMNDRIDLNHLIEPNNVKAVIE
jgi:predicted nucleic acid-binding Zn ribbon protein